VKINQKEFKQKQIDICNNHDVTEEERQKQMKELALQFIKENGGIVEKKN
jgi:hypothetical protein